MTMVTSPIFEAERLVKHFGAVTALDGVDFRVQRGEVHGLVGENGAGKSTLIRIAAGLLQQDGGTLKLDGHAYEPDSPWEANQQGVRVVSQEFDLAPNTSIAENLCLGSRTFLEGCRAGRFPWPRAMSWAADHLERVGVPLQPDTQVENLSVSERQLVALVRGVLDDPQIVFLDEPSSALDREGVEILSGLVDRLSQDGVAVVYVSHKLEEVFDLGDRITILRDGETAGVRDRTETTVDQVVNLMVGREIDRLFPSRPETEPGPIVLEVTNLTAPGVRDVGLTVREGEILGLGGLVGSGRTELAKAVCGLAPVHDGEIRVDGGAVSINHRTEALKQGIEYVTEDRLGEGLVLERPLAENVSMRVLDRFSTGPFVSASQERHFATEQMDRFRIAAPDATAPVKVLSGGNQQKTLLAACLASDPRVIFFDEPTRGIDVGAKAQIYEIIRELARDRAIVVVSAELIELLGLADRIAIMRGGEIAADFDAASGTEEQLVTAALGVEADARSPASPSRGAGPSAPADAASRKGSAS